MVGSRSGRQILVACLLSSALVAVADVAPPETKYNILFLLPVTFPSHRNVLLPIATALAARGHNVTMLNNLPAPDDNPNITYIEHGLPQKIGENLFVVRKHPTKLIRAFTDGLPELLNSLYDVPIVKELYERRESFDIMVLDHAVCEVAYPFVHGKPFITVSTPGLDTYQSAMMGNILNPAYISSIMYEGQHPLTFLERIMNIIFTTLFPVWYRNWGVTYHLQNQMNEIFPDLPPILELERNLSLTFINSHFSLEQSVPLLPNQVEVGGIYCRPGRPLPKDIEDFLSGPLPSIYFSLGTLAKGNTMPLHYREILIAAFAKLPYKILWKYESTMDNAPANVMIKKWLPQQDVLAHPNMKLFISHCGLLSSTESMCHGKPILGLPVMADQPKNARRLVNKGVARSIVWEEMTETMLVEAIEEILHNPSYLERASTISSYFRDQPQSASERAVYWTEYIARHGGGENLRAPQRDLSWREVFNLDIIIVLHLVVVLCYKSTKYVLLRIVKGKTTKKKSD